MVKFLRSLFGLGLMKKDSLTHSRLSISAGRAMTIARKFLEQYHSPVIFKSSHLNNETWMITMEVGLLKEDTITVRIDAETGKIQGYDHNVVPS